MGAVDAAVIGAGPAGSAAAITLAGFGWRVALIDRASFPRAKLCGDFVNPVNWPILETLGVAAEVLAAEHGRVSKFRLTSAAGDEIVGGLPDEAPPGFGLGLSRFHLDYILLRRAEAAGAWIFQGSRVTSLGRRGADWRLELEGAGGSERLECRLLIAADGRNSRTALRLGVPQAPADPSGAVGFELPLHAVDGVRDSVEIHQFPGGYAGLVRIDDRTVNLCFTVARRTVTGAMPYGALRAALLSRNPFLAKLLSGAEPYGALRSVSPVYFPPRRSFGDGFLLAGDAARVTEPVTGEGIYCALRSGQLAASAANDALRLGRLAEAQLAGYEKACRAEFKRRRLLNQLIRGAMYRPRLLSALIRVSKRRRALLEGILQAVCGRPAATPIDVDPPLPQAGSASTSVSKNA